MIKNKFSQKNIIIFIFSILFVIMYSYSTFYNIGNTDSVIFSSMGNFWNKGLIPYINCFDHKGPLIFYIYKLSYKIFSCQQGVLFFQIISTYTTLFFIEKIAFLELKNKSKSLILTCFTMFFLSILYSGGGMTEEFCLPFITSSFYLTLKIINNKGNINHLNLIFYFFGISFSVCFLTRLTNAISICISIIPIIILFFKNHNKIISKIFCFILGFLTLFLPFSFYFLYHNCFYDFIYGTLLFNFDYVSNAFLGLNNKYGILKFLLLCSPAYLLIIIGIIKIKIKNIEKGILYILLGIIESIFFISGNLWGNYFMIILPNVIVILCELENNIKKYKIIIYIMLILIWNIWNVIYIIKFNNLLLINRSKIDQLISKVDDRNSFVAVNFEDYVNIYNNNNILPYYKYFILQDWQASNSKSMKQDLINTFENGDVKYILIENIEKSVLKNVINKKYILIDNCEFNNNEIGLYKIK